MANTRRTLAGHYTRRTELVICTGVGLPISFEHVHAAIATQPRSVSDIAQLCGSVIRSMMPCEFEDTNPNLETFCTEKTECQPGRGGGREECRDGGRDAKGIKKGGGREEWMGGWREGRRTTLRGVLPGFPTIPVTFLTKRNRFRIFEPTHSQEAESKRPRINGRLAVSKTFPSPRPSTAGRYLLAEGRGRSQNPPPVVLSKWQAFPIHILRRAQRLVVVFLFFSTASPGRCAPGVVTTGAAAINTLLSASGVAQQARRAFLKAPISASTSASNASSAPDDLAEAIAWVSTWIRTSNAYGGSHP
eukprot:3448520-Rhodomonas_salina.1